MLGELARGGMGAILKVWDEDLRRNLAMKVVLGNSQTDRIDRSPDVGAEKLSRFLEEAQITGQLDHPGIVPVHDLGLDAQGRVYFTMPLIKGRDLKQIFELVREGREGWTRSRALGIFLKICEAMAFAHSKGVIHRDLKPSNIMVGRFGETYVMDWGLAKVLGREDERDLRPRSREPESAVPEQPSAVSLVRTDRRDEAEIDPESPVITMDGDVVGTPAYMSPEQAQGRTEDVGPRSDVYSVGAMLYHMLSGQMPYVAPGERVSPYTVLNAARTGPPRPLHQIDPILAPELVAICEKAMARSHEDRYPGMHAMAEDLSAFVEGRVVTAYETGRLARFRKWIVRNRGLAAFVGLSLLLAFGGLSGVLMVQVQARVQAESSKKEVEAALARAQENEQTAVLALERAEEASLEVVKALGDAQAERDRADASAREALRQNYVAGLSAADYSLRLNEVAEARRRLARTEELLRGWEWKHLELKSDTSLRAVQLAGSGRRQLAYTPDGERLVVAAGNTIQILDADDGSPTANWRVRSLWTNAFALAPSGELLAVGGGPFLQRGKSPVQVLATEGGEALQILVAHDTMITALAFGPASRLLLSADLGGRLLAWDVTTGEELWRWDSEDGAEEALTSLAFSPDGRLFAAGSESGELFLWRTQGWSPVGVYPLHEGPITGLGFDSRSELLVTASADKTAKVWDVAEERLQAMLVGHFGPLTDVAFSPDASWVATCSADGTAGAWNAETGAPLTTLRGHEDSLTSVAVHPSGDVLATCSKDGTLRLWDPRWSQAHLVIHGHDRPVQSLAFHPERGDWLYTVSTDRSLVLWDLSTGAAITADRSSQASLLDVATVRKGHAVAASSVDGQLHIWRDGLEGSSLTIPAHEDPIPCLAFSPDGARIASGSSDKSIRIWEVKSGRLLQILEGHDRRVSGLVFRDDGERLYSCSSDRTIRIWDTESGLELQRLGGHEKWINGVALSPGGTFLASCDQGGSVFVWDGDTGERLDILRGHEGAVESVAFSPDGQRLISGGVDGTVRVWSAVSGDLLLVLRIEEPAPAMGNAQTPSGASVPAVAFGPTGSRVAAVATVGPFREEVGEIWVWESEKDPKRTGSRRRFNAIYELARPLVEGLFDEFTTAGEVIEVLRTDDSLEENLRDVAIRMAKVGRVVDYEAKHEEAWQVVRAAGGTVQDYDLALRNAQASAAAEPAEVFYQIVLAAAHYRLEHFGLALEGLVALEEAAAGAQRPDRFVYHTFLGLTLEQLGRPTSALKSLLEARGHLEYLAGLGFEQDWMAALLGESQAASEGLLEGPDEEPEAVDGG